MARRFQPAALFRQPAGGGTADLTGAEIISGVNEEDAAVRRGFLSSLAEDIDNDTALCKVDGEVVGREFLAAPGVIDAFWTFNGSGNYEAVPFAAAIALLSGARSAVTTSGSGEKDITVTPATSYLVISPTGNMTIDQVDGLPVGATLYGVLVQDSSDRTLGLAGTSNAELGDDDALDMPSGSGARRDFMVVGRSGSGGSVVPTFYRLR